MKILIVDDKKENLYFLESLLNGFDYEVISAVNGKDALKKLRSDSFNMIISDILMPEMDGFQLLRSVKIDNNLKDIPFIFYTATYTDDKDKEFGLKLGACEYLEKPIDPEKIIKIIQGIFKDCESGVLMPKKPVIDKEEEVYKLYSERLVQKLENKMLDLEREVLMRKQVEKELTKLSAAVTQSPSVIAITDLKGNIEYVNPKFTQLTGYSTKEVIGKNSRILKSGEQTGEIYKDLWKTISSGKEWYGEFHNKKKNGDFFWEAASISSIYDKQGKVINYIKVAKDITEQKKIEIDLKEALKKATESDRLKSAFLATMSHELRTPLNAIIGFSGLINENLPMDSVISFAKTVNSSGEDLLTIVEDLFDITLIESGTSTIRNREVNLHTMLKELCEFVKIEQYNSNKSNLELNHTIPHGAKDLFINTDQPKLNQILTNLLKNAIKFTEDGHIKYGYEINSVNDKSMLKFYVEDTGIGIHKDKHELIFDMFRQGDDSHTRRFGGTGIGLSIAKRLVQFLGGEMWLESEVGKGSVFYFTIPYEEIEQIDVKSNEEIIQEKYNILKEKTILIVEDDETSYEYLKVVLEEYGTNIIWAKDGKSSIVYCKENPNIDMVLMDINMPEMNGYEATKEIKKFSPNLPVIAQTAFAIAGDREKAIDAGCDDYISKPIDRNELLDLIINNF